MQLLLLLEHLDRSQVRPYLCLLNGDSAASRQLRPNNLPILNLGVRRLGSFHAICQAYRFWRYLRANRIDIVQTYFSDSAIFAAPVAKLAAVGGVLGSRRNIGHGMSKWRARFAKLYNYFLIDRIVANCEASRRAVIEQENAPSDRVVVIRNGIQLEVFDRIPSWRPGPVGRPARIGMVGNLRDIKGPDVLIRAAKLVLEDYPGALFEIAGGGDSKPCQDLIRVLGVDECVRLLGPLSDIPGFLANLDIAVLPSRAEGLSNALLEYMAAGRPIVATDVGGTPELIKTDVNGLLVPPNSPEKLASGILKLIASPTMAEKLALEARESVRQLYSMHSVAECHSDLYRSVRHAKCGTKRSRSF